MKKRFFLCQKGSFPEKKRLLLCGIRLFFAFALFGIGPPDSRSAEIPTHMTQLVDFSLRTNPLEKQMLRTNLQGWFKESLFCPHICYTCASSRTNRSWPHLLFFISILTCQQSSMPEKAAIQYTMDDMPCSISSALLVVHLTLTPDV